MRFALMLAVTCLLSMASTAWAEGPFSQSACWDEYCPDELAACQAHPLCVDVAECIQDGGAVITCFNEIGSPTASDLYTAIQECGWEACATTEGSCQGVCSYFGPTVCNCDPLCEKYGDCCEDYWELCWEAPVACEPSCAGKACGDDGCGGVCGTCPPNAVCDAAGTCNDQCEDVCALGDSGCEGDVFWSCTPGPGGCPKKTTVDCSGGQMICDHGGCVLPPPTPDVEEPEPDAAPPDVPSGDLGPGTELSPPEDRAAPRSGPDADEEATVDPEDSAADVDPEASAADEVGLPTTQTASAPTVARDGCGGAPRGAPPWLEWILPLAILLVRLRALDSRPL